MERACSQAIRPGDAARATVTWRGWAIPGTTMRFDPGRKRGAIFRPAITSGRLQRRLKAVKLHLPATLEDLDFSASRGPDRRLILHLAQADWININLKGESRRKSKSPLPMPAT